MYCTKNGKVSEQLSGHWGVISASLHLLRDVIDSEWFLMTSSLSPQEGPTQWGAVDLGSDERKQKFLRLMGASKVRYPLPPSPLPPRPSWLAVCDGRPGFRGR